MYRYYQNNTIHSQVHRNIVIVPSLQTTFCIQTLRYYNLIQIVAL